MPALSSVLVSHEPGTPVVRKIMQTSASEYRLPEEASLRRSDTPAGKQNHKGGQSYVWKAFQSQITVLLRF